MTELEKFVRNNENWEELLTAAPYNLKISRDAPYIMFKYNQVTSDFNIPLVREARGIIFREDTWECVCHAFDKFGNYGESYCPDIDWVVASVQEKIDGSLIKLWYDDGKWHISTNGTIDAFEAQINDTKYHNFGDLVLAAIGDRTWLLNEIMDKSSTYMFELVSPYNRVVIPYEETDLYFLGWRDATKEYSRSLSRLSEYFKMPKTYDLYSLNDVIKAANALSWDEEGYVVCDANFNRVKIKSPQYVIAHYMRGNNNISVERLVQIILDGEQEEFLIYAADYADELHKVEAAMHDIAKSAVNALAILYGATYEYTERKEYATEVLKHPKDIRDFLFHCYDERIFFDYAKDWSAAKWAKIIEEKERNNFE